MVFLGFDFASGKSSLSVTPPISSETNKISISNAIVNSLKISSNLLANYDPDASWDSYTIIDAKFEGNINGGNITEGSGDISEIRIKRRVYGSYNWITIAVLNVGNNKSLSFVFDDVTTKSNEKYEYAIVPVLQGNEGLYSSSSITCEFDGVFVVDKDYVYQFLADSSYASLSRRNRTGRIETLGSKYPFVQSNNINDYHSGSFSGLAMSKKIICDSNSKKATTNQISNYNNLLESFLSSKTPKILKDYSGRIWLISVVDDINIEPVQNSIYPYENISFSWVEIGDYNSEEDLANSGFVKNIVGGES